MEETKLIKLLKLAQGSRSLNGYSRQADVSPGNLSRIMNGQKPTPEILKKLASKAHNDITYNELMIAAGYITDDNKELYAAPLTEKDELDIERAINKMKNDLSTQEGFMLSGEMLSDEAKEAIMESLASGIRYAKIINKKYTPKKYRKDNDKE